VTSVFFDVPIHVDDKPESKEALLVLSLLPTGVIHGHPQVAKVVISG